MDSDRPCIVRVVDEDVCGRCRSALETFLDSGVKYPGDDYCPPVFGTCGHAFHMQCVLKYG